MTKPKNAHAPKHHDKPQATAHFDAPEALAPGGAGDGVHTLVSLHASLGAVDEGLRARTFRVVSEDALVELGVKSDSQPILDDVPGFVAEAVAIRAALSPERAALVKLPAGWAALAVDEATKLAAAKKQHDATTTSAAGTKAARAKAERAAMVAGIALRDTTYDALRNALGPARLASLDATVGTAETTEKLALGLEKTADFIDDVLKHGSDDDRASLADFDAGEACAKALRGEAASVRGAGEAAAAGGRRVSQRALDAQDGRVLHLVGVGLRAFRAAHRVDAAILVPPLPRIGWIFETGHRRHPKDAAEDPAPAAPPGGGKPKDQG
jgi:hypothetical protein